MVMTPPITRPALPTTLHLLMSSSVSKAARSAAFSIAFSAACFAKKSEFAFLDMSSDYGLNSLSLNPLSEEVLVGNGVLL